MITKYDIMDNIIDEDDFIDKYKHLDLHNKSLYDSTEEALFDIYQNVLDQINEAIPCTETEFEAITDSLNLED